MNQPAAVPAVPAAVEPLRRRRRRLIAFAVIASAVLLGTAVVGSVMMIEGMIQRDSLRPWRLLHEAAVATQTPAGAEAFYQAHPGLAVRFPTPAAFLKASRGWAPKLAGVPATVPDFWTMLKSGGGNINITTSNQHLELSLSGYRGFSARVVLEGDQLVDLQVK